MDNILINPKTGLEYDNVPVDIARKYLGVSKRFLYAALQQGNIPIGTAAQLSGEWAYYIPAERLKAYKNAKDLILCKEV